MRELLARFKLQFSPIGWDFQRVDGTALDRRRRAENILRHAMRKRYEYIHKPDKGDEPDAKENTKLPFSTHVISLTQLVDAMQAKIQAFDQKIFFESDLFMLSTKQSRLSGMASYLHSTLVLIRWFEIYTSFSLNPFLDNDSYSSATNAVASKLSAMEYETQMLRFKTGILGHIHSERHMHKYQSARKQGTTHHQEEAWLKAIKTIRDRPPKLPPLFQLGDNTIPEKFFQLDFPQFNQFSAYALSLSHAEQNEHITAFVADHRQSLVKHACSELSNHAHSLCREIVAKQPAGSEDFLLDVNPVLNFMNQMAPFVRTVESVVYNENDIEKEFPHMFFVIPVYDFQRTLNKLARAMLYFDEKEFASGLEEILGVNTHINEKLYQNCYANSSLQAVLEQRQNATTNKLQLQFSDQHLGIILDLDSCRQQLRRTQDALFSQQEFQKVEITKQLDSLVQKLSSRLRFVINQFENHKQKLNRVIAHSAKEVKHALLSKVDGKFNEHSMLKLLAMNQQAEVLRRLFKSDEFEVAKRDTDVLKKQLLVMKSQFDRQLAVHEGKHKQMMSMVSSELPNHSVSQRKLLVAVKKEEELLTKLTTLKYLLSQATLNGETLRSALSKINLEKKKLLQWRQDNAVKFLELRAKNKSYSMLNLDVIREMESLKDNLANEDLEKIDAGEVEDSFYDAVQEEEFEQRQAHLKRLLTAKMKEKEQAYSLLESLEEQHKSTLKSNNQATLEDIGCGTAKAKHSLQSVWDAARMHAHIANHEQLCADLEAENEIIRGVIKNRTSRLIDLDTEVVRPAASSSWDPSSPSASAKIATINAKASVALEGLKTAATTQVEPDTFSVRNVQVKATRITAHSDFKWNRPAKTLGSVKVFASDGSSSLALSSHGLADRSNPFPSVMSPTRVPSKFSTTSRKPISSTNPWAEPHSGSFSSSNVASELPSNLAPEFMKAIANESRKSKLSSTNIELFKKKHLLNRRDPYDPVDLVDRATTAKPKVFTWGGAPPELLPTRSKPGIIPRLAADFGFHPSSNTADSGTNSPRGLSMRSAKTVAKGTRRPAQTARPLTKHASAKSSRRPYTTIQHETHRTGTTDSIQGSQATISAPDDDGYYRPINTARSRKFVRTRGKSGASTSRPPNKHTSTHTFATSPRSPRMRQNFGPFIPPNIKSTSSNLNGQPETRSHEQRRATPASLSLFGDAKVKMERAPKILQTAKTIYPRATYLSRETDKVKSGIV